MSIRFHIVASSLAAAALFAGGCDKGPGPTAAPAKSAPEAAKATAPATPKAPEGKTYGDKLAITDTVAIADILAEPDKYEGKDVRVEGMVTDVCPKRGCWFDMAGTAPGQKMRFKVTDGVMVFPMDSKGKHAVAEGTVKVMELSLEETRKYAAYQAEEMGQTFDPASVTEPRKIVRLDGKGAVIRDQK